MPITVSGGMSITGGLSTLDAPALSLDFMSGTLDSRITFSRGTQATMVDSTGRLTYAPNNLLTYSEQFDNSAWAWTTTNVTITADNTISPTGTLTADKLIETTANSTHRVIQSLTLADNTTYIASFYVKAAERTKCSIQTRNKAGTVQSASFDLTTATSDFGIITSVGNGWYRISYSMASSSGATVPYIAFLLADAAGNLTYTGNGTSGIFLWGAQLEAVTYQTAPSPYNRTTVAAYYGPRFDYDPISLQPKGLLIEEQRTNLITNSNDISAGLGTTVSLNVINSPDGTSNADKLVEDTSNGAHWSAKSFSTTSGQVYAYTVYLKAAERTEVTVFTSGNLGGGSARINLSDGSVSNITSGLNPTVTNVGSGWYKVVYTATASTTGTGNLYVQLHNNAGSYQGDGTSGVYVWGQQAEAGAFATSYIPTVASTVTRNADTAVMTGTNFSSWYNQSEGTFVASASTTVPIVTNVYNIFSANFNGSGNDQIRAFVYNGKWGTSGSVGGVVQFDLQEISSYTINLPGKIAVGYKLNDIASCVNGATLRTDTVASIPTVNQLSLSIAFPLNGTIRSVEYYSSRLNNDAIQLLSRL